MNVASLRRSRVLWLGAAFSMVPFVACVESDGAPNRAPGEDAGGSEAAVLPDSTPPDAGPGTEDGSADSGPGHCSEGGFCSVPIPTQEVLVDITATSIDDAWALAGDAVLRWDGKEWKTAYQYRYASLARIMVVNASDLWIIGTRLIIRYSALPGEAPTFRAYPYSTNATVDDVTGVWASPAGEELWVTFRQYGTTPMAYRFREELDSDGGRLIADKMTDAALGFPWTTDVENFAVHSVFGFAPNDVYVGGLFCSGSCPWHVKDEDRYGAVAHYDGERWSIAANFGKADRVSAIYGSKATDPRQLWIWAGIAGVTENSIRLHPLQPDGTLGLAQYSRSIRTDEGPYSPYRAFDYACHRVVGSVAGPTAAWFSDLCFVYRWNGEELETTSTAVNGVPLGRVVGVWASSSEEAWIVGATPSPIGSYVPIGFSAVRRRAP